MTALLQCFRRCRLCLIFLMWIYKCFVNVNLQQPSAATRGGGLNIPPGMAKKILASLVSLAAAFVCCSVSITHTFAYIM